MFDNDEDSENPNMPVSAGTAASRPLDISDIGQEALRLLGDYVPRHFTDKKAAEAWAAEQVRLLMLADQTDNKDFLRDYPRALILLAKAEGVEITRGKERLIQDRFLIIGRLILRIITKI